LTRLLAGSFTNVTVLSSNSFSADIRYGGLIPATFKFFIGEDGPGTARWDVSAGAFASNASFYGDSVTINLEYTFRSPHSKDLPFACFRPFGTRVYTSCSSDISNATFGFGSVNNASSVIVRLMTDGLDGYLSYPIEVYADDALVGGVFAQGTPFAEPYGFAAVPAALRLQGRDIFTDPYFGVPKALPDDQWTSVFANLDVPVWTSSLVYDPSVSLTFLFQDEQDNVTAPIENTAINTATNVVTIAVVVSVVVVVIIGLSVLAVVKVIFPYYQKRQDTAAEPKQDIEEDPDRSTQRDTGKWKAVTPTTNK
jgi:hypothetical protein